MAWFRRRRSVEQRIAAARAARDVSLSLRVDELPITQGIVQTVADVVASLDLVAVDERTGQPVRSQPQLCVQPDPREDRAETLHKMVQALWWTGNAPTSVAGRGTAACAIRVLNPSLFGYEPDPADDLAVRWWWVNGRPFPVDALHVWKLNDDPRRGPLGRSPFDACHDALGLYGWAYRHLIDHYAQGGLPNAVLRSARPLGASPVPDDPSGRTEAQIAQDAWVTSRQLYRPAVLDPQWTLEAAPAPADLEQTVRVLEFSAQEVARLTGMPASIANVTAASPLTYANVQDELRRWLLLGLGPQWLRRMERGFTALLPAGLVARFDQDTLTRFDVLETAQPALPAPALRAVS